MVRHCFAAPKRLSYFSETHSMIYCLLIKCHKLNVQSFKKYQKKVNFYKSQQNPFKSQHSQVPQIHEIRKNLISSYLLSQSH